MLLEQEFGVFFEMPGIALFCVMEILQQITQESGAVFNRGKTKVREALK